MNVPAPVPGALCPWRAMLVRLPPEPLKMPCVALPPVTLALKATVAPPLISGTRKSKNVPAPVPGALCPFSGDIGQTAARAFENAFRGGAAGHAGLKHRGPAVIQRGECEEGERTRSGAGALWPVSTIGVRLPPEPL